MHCLGLLVSSACIGHYFRVWFAVLDNPFTLMYLNRADYQTKLLEEQVLDEVRQRHCRPSTRLIH